MEARQGTFVFDIDQTYCSQQGKLTENTIIRGEKTKRPKKNKKKQKKYAQRSSHCFVMGLLITFGVAIFDSPRSDRRAVLLGM